MGSVNQEINVIRSARKTLSLEVRPNGEILVRAPYYARNAEIERFVREHGSWIDKQLARVEAAALRPCDKLTSEELKELASQACRLLPERVRYYAPLLGVNYGRITIRNQRTRWGSCSSKGNLNFNCLLMLTPSEVMDYVVVHELCHRIEMNHSPRFWALVESVLPDYKTRRKWLKDHGAELMARNP